MIQYLGLWIILSVFEILFFRKKINAFYAFSYNWHSNYLKFYNYKFKIIIQSEAKKEKTNDIRDTKKISTGFSSMYYYNNRFLVCDFCEAVNHRYKSMEFFTYNNFFGIVSCSAILAIMVNFSNYKKGSWACSNSLGI